MGYAVIGVPSPCVSNAGLFADGSDVIMQGIGVRFSFLLITMTGTAMLKFLPENKGFRCDLITRTEEKLNVGIIDADLLDHGTRHPNLALLKISAFCKAQGHYVRLVWTYDE